MKITPVRVGMAMVGILLTVALRLVLNVPYYDYGREGVIYPKQPSMVVSRLP